jgi:PAS domain S-box-containing protein
VRDGGPDGANRATLQTAKAQIPMSDRTATDDRAAERRDRQIIESAVDYGIVSCDLDAVITGWNEGARRIMGWTEQEMVGQRLHRIFTAADVAAGAVEAEIDGARESGRGLDERWHQRKDGSCFWASGELMPLRDGDAIVGYVKFLRDRTEQRRVDEELRAANDRLLASEARLQLALEVGGMGVWQGDLRTRQNLWWPGMEQVHGLPPGTRPVSMGEYYNLVHPDDRDRVRAVVEDALERRLSHRVEYRVIWPDGSIHWIEGRAKLVLDADGRPQTMSGVCQDITRRKNIEQDLAFLAEASAELADFSDYQGTLDNIARLAVPHFADWCAVDMLDEEGVLRRVAAAHVEPGKVHLAHELFRRYPPDPDQPGGTWQVLRTGKAELTGQITPAMLEEGVRDRELLRVLLTLGLRSYIGAPLVVRGRTLGVITFITAESRREYNVGDLALAEDLGRRAAVAIDNANLVRMLKDSDRAKDVFLATLAHELRNPLAPIWHGLSIIKFDPRDRERVEQVTGMIERQVGQLTRLVDDLLDVSRIATGKIELKKEPTNLVSILNSAIEISRPNIEAAHHKLSVTFPVTATDLVADPVRLAQVFSNLLNNACKYTRAGGEIDVVAEASDDQLVVRVRDTGTGIPADMLRKVFSIFTQVVTHPMERRQGGLGIGLSLVEGLVRLHGGTVEACSEGPDCGSEFIVTLPRATASVAAGGAASRPGAEAVPAPASPRRILVVDDNIDAAGTVAELLRIFGNQVSVVHDGLGAVQEVARLRPDVVLLDIGLPDIDGYEVARRVRRLEGVRQPTLIALTGWGQQADKVMAAEAGFDQHWTKPVDPSRLQELSGRSGTAPGL